MARVTTSGILHDIIIRFGPSMHALCNFYLFGTSLLSINGVCIVSVDAGIGELHTGSITLTEWRRT